MLPDTILRIIQFILYGKSMGKLTMGQH